MLRNYFRVALRNLRNYKAYSFINIAGLSVGIACCIMIALYVQNELSYDKFNVNADRICRPRFLGRANGQDMNMATSPVAMGPTVYRDLPDVESYTRLSAASAVVRYKDKTFTEERFFGADSTVFDVFTFPLVAGNPKTALTQPNTVVITESIAHKYFGDENPIGKILDVGKQYELAVTGVMKDVPQDSHLHPDFLASLTTLTDSRSPAWLGNNYYTYFLLRKGVSLDEFRKEFNEEVVKYVGPQFKGVFDISLDQFKTAGNKYGYTLQPLTSIHLHSHLEYEIEPNGSVTYVYIFMAIAIAILLIACINFINLSTARSERRAKEVGVRKTLGSTRSFLVGQFISESVLMSLVATLLAVGIVELLLPLFSSIANKKMSFSIFSDPLSIPLLLGFALLVGIISGGYPAFYLSSFRPVDVLKSKRRKGGRESFLRNGLVVFQFVISIALFIGTLVIYSQLKFVQTKNLGFDKEETLVINRTNDLGNLIHSFEHELTANRDITSVTNSTGIPGDLHGDSGFWLEGTGVDKVIDLQTMMCDFNFAKTYKLQMADGRFFSNDHPSDTAAVVVNEEVGKAFGTKDMVGRFLVLPTDRSAVQRRLEVVGVVKDFNYSSLHEPVRPLVMSVLPTGSVGAFVTVRLAPGDHLSTISFIRKIWKKYAVNEGFDFSFLDDSLQNLYALDQRTNEIAGAFSVLAIFIASLGLLGLAAFTTEQRTKEIGIRKVLGASVPEVIALLSGQFTRWVLIANVVAWPLAYYIMNKWLQNFAYRTSLNTWIFVASGAIALIIALLTVSSHAIIAATANPVESLRYE